MERNLHEPEIYDFRQHDRLWQRVGPGLEPYPETTAEAMPRREELPPAQESQLPGAEPNPCCMGSEAMELLAVLEGYIEEELEDRRRYLALSRQAPSWARQTLRDMAEEENGHARFPDAPTERGVKHLHELMRAVAEGHRATVFFVLQMAGMTDFAPNDDTHPAFGAALRQAAEAGVHVAAYGCRVTPDTLELDRPVPVIL